MKTVAEVSRLTGVSVRTLHHYDSIGLLKPTKVTEVGYRLYDAGAADYSSGVPAEDRHSDSSADGPEEGLGMDQKQVKTVKA